jgi:hypothetical protein
MGFQRDVEAATGRPAARRPTSGAGDRSIGDGR